jgi:imidazoleglycerol-phosphate dehydratase/histidinol-phosphatase
MKVYYRRYFVDRSFPEDNAPTRKPRTGMLTKYIDNPEYDLANSCIRRRLTDVELLKPWCKGNFMNDSDGAGSEEISAKREELDETIVLQSMIGK